MALPDSHNFYIPKNSLVTQNVLLMFITPFCSTAFIIEKYIIHFSSIYFNCPQFVFCSMWNKRPTRCHLVIYLFLLYNLLNIFRAALCPSSGADDLEVFIRCVAEL